MNEEGKLNGLTCRLSDSSDSGLPDRIDNRELDTYSTYSNGNGINQLKWIIEFMIYREKEI